MKRLPFVLVAMLALAAGWIYTQYQAEQAAVSQQLESGSRVAHTACGPIEYAVAGTGPAVLLVHGAGGGYAQVAALSDWVEAAGFTAIAMSRFGYLRTPLPPDASPAAQADAHACLLETVGFEQAAVVGLSAGAPSALYYCARHAERCNALALLVPAITIPGRAVADTTPPSPFWQFVFDYALRSDFVIWSVTRAWPEMLVETVLATPPEVFQAATTSERARALEVIRDIFPVSLKLDGLTNDALVTTPAPLPDLHRITAPMLAISADDDLYGTAEGARYLADQVSDARLLVFASGGHAWLGHDVEVHETLLDFLRRHAPYGNPKEAVMVPAGRGERPD